MQDSLLALAETDDWLKGVSRPKLSYLDDAEVQALAERMTGIPPLQHNR